MPITTQSAHADDPVYGYSDTVIRVVLSLEELAPFSPHLRDRLKRLWARDSHGL